MTHYELFLAACVKTLDVLLCVLVYARHLQSRLPFFTFYATTILLGSLSTTFAFAYFGFHAPISYYISWLVMAMTLVARSAAIAELCYDSLRSYKGIWALAWRILGAITVCCFIFAALDVQGQPKWFAPYSLAIERNVEFSSVIVLTAMLAIGAYYHLTIEPLQKWIAVGICLFCLIQLVNSTVLHLLFVRFFSSWPTSWPAVQSQVARTNELWNTVYVGASCAAIGIWCFALRKELPARAQDPVLLPNVVYQELSPAINLRLRTINERLVEMLRP